MKEISSSLQNTRLPVSLILLELIVLSTKLYTYTDYFCTGLWKVKKKVNTSTSVFQCSRIKAKKDFPERLMDKLNTNLLVKLNASKDNNACLKRM